MIEEILAQVADIFVGRVSELKRLESLWTFACQDREHLVYVFLNAPGVGKTTLIDHFGKSIEAEGKGLFIKFICSSDYDSPLSFNKNIVKLIELKIQTNKKLINNYLSNNIEIDERDWFKKNLEQIQSFINKLLTNASPTIGDIRDIFVDLARILPIFFAIDEIQELQKIQFNSKQNENSEQETGLHYFSRILKNLLNSKILLVLSGTRYHILNQIGGDLGSPIRQKVEPLIIQKFNEKEVNSYVDQVRFLINKAGIIKKNENLQIILKNYKIFLFAFSGGHPRTMEKITKLFLSSLSILLTQSEYLNYEAFMKYLLPKAEEFFSNSLLSSVHKQSLSKLAVSKEFSVVKEWLLNRATQGQFLRDRPKFLEYPQKDEEIKRIVYELMNIGIIVQNGNYNYHITSYFHFNEFLNLYQETYEIFLREVLHNRYFKLMCGFHSGFGYTFENVFLAALIIRGSKNQQKITLPIQIKRFRSLKVLKGKVNWSKIKIESNILYQTPLADNIDGFVLQDNVLLLMQITTANPPNPLKIKSLLSEMDALSELKLEVIKNTKVHGWFISLFKLKEEPPLSNLLITTSEQLIPLIGKELYTKLKAVKESFTWKN